jgi:hypothetical protein
LCSFPSESAEGEPGLEKSDFDELNKGPFMRIALNFFGVLLVLFGSIWFLQGINILPGSFMTGQVRWAVYGGIAVAAGVGLLFRANRRRRAR